MPETPDVSPGASSCRSRSLSQTSSDRRPLGPRSPSPLPRLGSPRKLTRDLPSFDDELAQNSISDKPSSLPGHLDSPSMGIPRSRRQPFFHPNTDATPKSSATTSSAAPTTIEPLSIKKKSSTRSAANAPVSPTPARRSYVRNSPLNRPSVTGRIVSPRRIPSQIRRGKAVASLPSLDNEAVERLVQYSQSTKDDVSLVLCVGLCLCLPPD